MTPDKMRTWATNAFEQADQWWYKQFVLAVADLAEEVKALGELHDSSTRNRIALRGELADLADHVAKLEERIVWPHDVTLAEAHEELRKEVKALRERVGAVETRLPKPSDEPSFVGGGV